MDSSGNATAYATAFPDAEDNMGCNESAVTIASNDTGNPACSGYELDADLDFDTDGNGGPNSGDTYWNSGAGWTPIGDYTNPFVTTFDGQGSTHKISNLYVNASTTADDADADLGGLFGVIGKDGAVEDLGLESVSVTVSSTQENEVYAGAVAGDNRGTITGSWSSGSVTASTGKNGAAKAYAGGLVGRNDKGGSGANAYTGAIRASYSRASVTARGRTQSPGNADGTEAAAGGLAGRNNGVITTGFSTGDATATRYSSTGTYPWRAITGGLVGINDGTVTAAYADADAAATSYTTGSSSAAAISGGLVGENLSGATVTASYSTGAPTTAGHTSPDVGGLVGSNSGTVTDGYWDTTTSGVSTAGAGTGKTTAEIKAPTAYGTGANDIYKDWNVNVDGVSGDDDPWNFGTAAQYPILKYSGLSSVTQRATVTLSFNPATICESTAGTDTNACGASPPTSSTVTATVSPTWIRSVTVTPAADAATYTLGASTVTVAAGSASGSTTLTAVNNRNCGTASCPATKVDKTVSLTATSGDPWVNVGTAPSLTITGSRSGSPCRWMRRSPRSHRTPCSPRPR